MTAGRLPSWNPIADIHASVWTEAVVLTSKDRMALPVATRRRLTWMASTSISVVGVLDAVGSTEIVPWAGEGEAQIAAVERALAVTPEPARSELALAAMDRYVRLTIDGDGRVVLPTTLLAHLDAALTPLVRVVLRSDRLWLWSETRWRAAQAARITALQKAMAGVAASGLGAVEASRTVHLEV